MPGRPAKPKRRKSRVSAYLNFDVFEAATALSVTRETVRRWIKRDALRTVDAKRPLLIAGADLNAFLKARREAQKRRCQPGEIYCLKCRDSRRPVPGMIDYLPNGRSAGNLQAICGQCGTIMNRRCAQSRIAAVLPNLDVTIRQG